MTIILKKKNFYFVRHAESVHNQLKICAGSGIDSPLSEKGINQAKRLNKKLAAINIDFVVSSPLIRAKTTASIAFSGEVVTEENLREFNFGDFEGRKDEGIDEFLENLPSTEAIPNGESKQNFQERVVDGVNYWLGSDEPNILFVAHGGVYCALLTSIGAPWSDLANCQLVRFEVDSSGRWATTTYLDKSQ